jgi:RNA ligase (TIGR02306 family)
MTAHEAPPTETTAGRRLATIERIAELAPIPGADAIVRARVRGWDVVVKKGEFGPGDVCVYFEVDSLLDVTDARFEFLAARGVRTDGEGNSGHVLKTARLRGQYSQGLALPVVDFPELGQVDATRAGEDVTAVLGILRWEPPLPAELAGTARGMRPSWIPGTDEERVQNVAQILTAEADWVATEKLDGMSTTFWVTRDDHGTCTRNLDLIEQPSSQLWRLGATMDVHERLRASGLGDRVALQGEAFGAGIQKNPLRIDGHRLRPSRCWPTVPRCPGASGRRGSPSARCPSTTCRSRQPWTRHWRRSSPCARRCRPTAPSRASSGGPPTGRRSAPPTTGACGRRSRSSATAT